MPRRRAITNRLVPNDLTRSTVLAKHSSTRIRRIRIAALFILAYPIRTHRHLTPIALIVRRTLAHHAVHIVRAFATVLAEITTRIRLTLFAPESLIAFADGHFQKVQRTISVATAVAIADALLTTIASEATGTFALPNAGGCVQLTDAVRFALQMVAVLTFRSMKTSRTVTGLDLTANNSARGTVVATILKCRFIYLKTKNDFQSFNSNHLAKRYRILASVARPKRRASASQRGQRHRCQTSFFVGKRINMTTTLVLAVARTAKVFAKLAVVLFWTNAAISIVNEFAHTVMAREIAVLGWFRSDFAFKGDLQKKNNYYYMC